MIHLPTLKTHYFNLQSSRNLHEIKNRLFKELHSHAHIPRLPSPGFIIYSYKKTTTNQLKKNTLSLKNKSETNRINTTAGRTYTHTKEIKLNPGQFSGLNFRTWRSQPLVSQSLVGSKPSRMFSRGGKYQVTTRTLFGGGGGGGV